MSHRSFAFAVPFVLALSAGCGGATSASPSQTASVSNPDTTTSAAESSERARALDQWNAELARLRVDPLFATTYDERLAALDDRAPTAEACTEIDWRIARAPEVGCDPSERGCARPSDTDATEPGPPAFDHECPTPAGSIEEVDALPGVSSISSEDGSRLEGCSAAWVTWLFSSCPE